MDLAEQIYKHEGGSHLKPYLDCCGKYWRECKCVNKGFLTIGVGRNLDSQGLSVSEAYLLFQNDLRNAKVDLSTRIPWVDAMLDEPRYAVLVNMCFNMGIGRLLGFRKMLSAIKRGNWQEAHDELLDSKYAKQVGDKPGQRAAVLADQLLFGKWQV